MRAPWRCCRPTNRGAQKRFVVRSSLLSTMLTNKDFQTIYHIFIAIMVWLGLSMVLNEYLEKGCVFAQPRLRAAAVVHAPVGRSGIANGWGMFWWAFSKMDFVVPCWCVMFTYSFS